MVTSKPWYTSVTLWLNVVAGLLMYFQTLPALGVPLTPRDQAEIIFALNLVNRFRTFTALIFTNPFSNNSSNTTTPTTPTTPIS